MKNGSLEKWEEKVARRAENRQFQHFLAIEHEVPRLSSNFSSHFSRACNLTSVGLWRRNDEKQQPAAACKMIYKGGERGERDHWPEEEHGSVAPLFSRARKTRVISTMGGNGEEQISEEAPAPTVN